MVVTLETVLLHPVVVMHLGRLIDIGFTRPPPQEATEHFVFWRQTYSQ